MVNMIGGSGKPIGTIYPLWKEENFSYSIHITASIMRCVLIYFFEWYMIFAIVLCIACNSVGESRPPVIDASDMSGEFMLPEFSDM